MQLCFISMVIIVCLQQHLWHPLDMHVTPAAIVYAHQHWLQWANVTTTAFIMHQHHTPSHLWMTERTFCFGLGIVLTLDLESWMQFHVVTVKYVKAGQISISFPLVARFTNGLGINHTIVPSSGEVVSLLKHLFLCSVKPDNVLIMLIMLMLSVKGLVYVWQHLEASY